MLKALVFDFDGVIVDTEVEWYYIYRDWLKKNYLYDLQIKDYLVCVGANSESLFSFIEQELGANVPIREFEKTAMEEFIKRTNKLPAMDGVEKLLKEAKEKGIKIAIATSATRKKPYTHLKRLHLIEYFDALSTAELSENIKPAPDIFLKAAELLKCKPEECLAIEDSLNGLIAAQRANMPCLIVPNRITENSKFEGYYQKVSSLKDINLQGIIDDFQNKDKGESLC